MTIAKHTMRLGLALAGGIALAGSAFAGACPADQMRPDGSGEKVNSTPAKDVSDTVLTSIDLAKEPAAVKDRLLRLRRLEIKPGGVVPWHSHGNRPAIITDKLVVWVADSSKDKGTYIAVFNRGNESADIHYSWKELGLTGRQYSLRDLWQQADADKTESLTAKLLPHACLLYRATKVD